MASSCEAGKAIQTLQRVRIVNEHKLFVGIEKCKRRARVGLACTKALRFVCSTVRLPATQGAIETAKQTLRVLNGSLAQWLFLSVTTD